MQCVSLQTFFNLLDLTLNGSYMYMHFTRKNHLKRFFSIVCKVFVVIVFFYITACYLENSELFTAKTDIT